MDSRAPIPSRNRPWPVVLATLLLIKLFWCLKLYYSLVRGDLIGTPAQKMSTHVRPLPLLFPSRQDSADRLQVMLNTAVALMEVVAFPGLHLYSTLRGLPWPTNPAFFFAQSFVWAINDTTLSIMTLLYRHHRLPPTAPPSTPGSDPAAAREYRAWRAVDLPLFAILHMLTAVVVVVNCATWLRRDFDRKRRAERDVELRDLRVRDMFRRGWEDGWEAGSGSVVTGVVHGEGDEGAKGGEA